MQVPKEEEEFLRVVVIGDSSVGKTSIISKLVCGEFSESEKTTVGAMFVLYTIKLDEGDVQIQLWDTAGQERFRSLGPLYYRNAKCGLIVLDFTKIDTFLNLDTWINAFTSVAGSDVSVVIVGNKFDLVSDRQVSDLDIQAFLETHNYPFFATSATDNESIQQLFKRVGLELYKKRVSLMNANELNSKLQEKTKYSCC